MGFPLPFTSAPRLLSFIPRRGEKDRLLKLKHAIHLLIHQKKYQDDFETAKKTEIDLALMAKEVERRRTFCIIAHPDAGKTTLTEKLLLYGGAIQEAGSVKARRASKSATSDFMEMEKQRGISISSTALTFPYNYNSQTYQLNLLDTPGHSDFGEDTYRTLSAADNAVMLVDGAKGIEPQTRKLFAVAKLKKVRNTSHG